MAPEKEQVARSTASLALARGGGRKGQRDLPLHGSASTQRKRRLRRLTQARTQVHLTPTSPAPHHPARLHLRSAGAPPPPPPPGHPLRLLLPLAASSPNAATSGGASPRAMSEEDEDQPPPKRPSASPPAAPAAAIRMVGGEIREGGKNDAKKIEANRYPLITSGGWVIFYPKASESRGRGAFDLYYSKNCFWAKVELAFKLPTKGTLSIGSVYLLLTSVKPIIIYLLSPICPCLTKQWSKNRTPHTARSSKLGSSCELFPPFQIISYFNFSRYIYIDAW